MVLFSYQTQPQVLPNQGLHTPWQNKMGFLQPEMQVIQLAGSTTGTAAAGTWTTGLGAYRDISVFIDVTGTNGTAALGTFFIDTRFDGTGTTSVAASIGLGSGTKYLLQLSKNRQPGTGVDISADVTAGTIRAIGWADDLRARLALTGTSPLLTYRVWINAVG